MAKTKEYAIGVDLGGTSIKVGVVSKSGKIVKKTAVETLADQGPKVVIEQIKKGIRQVSTEYKKQIQAIGIGSPGVVNAKKGTVENPPNLPGWGKVNLGKILEKEFGLPVMVENDANAAAIGELIFGAGKKFSDFIMVTLGTGVGGGLILKDKLFRGEMGGAGELGHMTIDYKGNACNCGSVGCVETYVGNNYLVERVIKELEAHPGSKIQEMLDYDMSKLTPKIIHDAALEGDEFAKKVIDDTGRYLGYALASSVNLLDVSNVIIGGGVAGFGEPLFNSVRETIKDRALKSFADKIKVIPAKLKNEAGIKGASALVFYNA